MTIKRLLAMFAAGTLVLSACGGDTSEPNDVAAQADVAAQTPAELATPTEETMSDDGENEGEARLTAPEWAGQVIEAWETYQDAFTAAAIEYVNGYEDGPGQVALAITLFEALVPAYETLLTSLPPATADEQLVQPYDSFVLAVDTAGAAAIDTLDDLRANEAVYIDEITEGGIFGSSYEVTRLRFNDADVALDAACFPLQAAMVTAGLPILQCADDGGEADEDAAGCSVDPVTEATGVERCFLEPGEYSFAVFGKPLTVTLNEPILISTDDRVIDFGAANELGQFQVFAADALADPATLSGGNVEATVPLPVDIEAWAEQLPVVVEASGVSTLFSTESTYIKMQVDLDAALALGGDPIVAIIPSDSVWGDYNLVPDMTFTLWQVDHPAGTVVVIAADEDGPLDEVSWVESILGNAMLG